MAASKLSDEQRDELLAALGTRFGKNMNRHPALDWETVRARLVKDAGKLWSLHEMERTGGEPDVIGQDTATGEIIFVDCAPESPKGRRSTCYDQDALDARKEHKPADSAVNMAAALGIELLTEAEYRKLQELGEFDVKTSSWVKTPATIRKLGGALFCDRRYNTVFLYHNGGAVVLRSTRISRDVAGVVRLVATRFLASRPRCSIAALRVSEHRHRIPSTSPIRR